MRNRISIDVYNGQDKIRIKKKIRLIKSMGYPQNIIIPRILDEALTQFIEENKNAE